MRKQMIKVLDLPSAENKVILTLLLISFLFGAFVACVLVSRVDIADNDILDRYFSDYFTALRATENLTPNLWLLLWDIFRWPLLILVLGISPIGLFCIPVLFAAKGFLLSFSIASLFRVLGAPGLLVAFSVFGVSGVLCVPALFAFGMRCFALSGAVVKRLYGAYRNTLLNKADVIYFLICVAGLCVGLLLEYCLVPRLLLYFSEIIP